MQIQPYNSPASAISNIQGQPIIINDFHKYEDEIRSSISAYPLGKTGRNLLQTENRYKTALATTEALINKYSNGVFTDNFDSQRLLNLAKGFSVSSMILRRRDYEHQKGFWKHPFLELDTVGRNMMKITITHEEGIITNYISGALMGPDQSQYMDAFKMLTQTASTYEGLMKSGYGLVLITPPNMYGIVLGMVRRQQIHLKTPDMFSLDEMRFILQAFSIQYMIVDRDALDWAPTSDPHHGPVPLGARLRGYPYLMVEGSTLYLKLHQYNQLNLDTTYGKVDLNETTADMFIGMETALNSAKKGKLIFLFDEQLERAETMVAPERAAAARSSAKHMTPRNFICYAILCLSLLTQYAMTQV